MRLNLKTNQIYLKQVYLVKNMMSIPYQKIDYKKIILVTTFFGGFTMFFTFSIVFRLKQPFHVDNKMKRLDIMQCMFKKKFFWAYKAFIKIQTFKKGVVLWCFVD